MLRQIRGTQALRSIAMYSLLNVSETIQHFFRLFSFRHNEMPDCQPEKQTATKVRFQRASIRIWYNKEEIGYGRRLLRSIGEVSPERVKHGGHRTFNFDRRTKSSTQRARANNLLLSSSCLRLVLSR